jgi:hypothetical protein
MQDCRASAGGRFRCSQAVWPSKVKRLQFAQSDPKVPKEVGVANCCVAYGCHCLARGGDQMCEVTFPYRPGGNGGWRGRYARVLHLCLSPQASRGVKLAGMHFVSPADRYVIDNCFPCNISICRVPDNQITLVTIYSIFDIASNQFDVLQFCP